MEERSMHRRTIGFKSLLLVQLAIGSLALSNCGSMPSTSELSSAPSSAAVAPIDATADSIPNAIPSQPQLAKTAEMAMVVDAVEPSIDRIRTIVQQHQGDLLGLSDDAPLDETDYRTASLQVRVPQQQLDAALDAFSQLGTVQRRSLTAEDVSTQLVDHQARLRNLRKTEDMLLEIMERSGGVADVLKVAQELSNVRNSIEQVDAQLQSLQNRVAYSTINITLEEAIATSRSTSTQLQTTWESATYSLGKFTVDLMQLGIWLMVYSPYLLLLGGLAAGIYWRRKSRQPIATTSKPPQLPE